MTIVLLILVLGVGTTFWSIVGLGRIIAGRRLAGRATAPAGESDHRRRRPPPAAGDVAILLAAHNEELVIEATIEAAASLVGTANVHIISDGSKDETALVARRSGANVLELNPNRGKAGALAAGIEHFDLCNNFDVVLLLDADTHLAPDYLATGLPLFGDPEVVAVAGRAKTIARPAPASRIGRYLVSYRERLYLIVQVLLKFGQAARWANAVTIVPGFASMYRTSALRHIDVTGAGLVIEDFNMTFEVHLKKLGRIEFHPGAAVAYTQDPDHFGDYVKQVRRWILGFWQTVRRHGLHRGFFWFALALFIIELTISCIVLVVLVPVLLLSVIASTWVAAVADPFGWAVWLGRLLTPRDVLLGFLLPDYALTIFAAIALKRPRFLLVGVFFPFMRIVDAWICLSVLPRAWVTRSSGVWVSPTRRPGLAAPVMAGSLVTAKENSAPSSQLEEPQPEPLLEKTQADVYRRSRMMPSQQPQTSERRSRPVASHEHTRKIVYDRRHSP